MMPRGTPVGSLLLLAILTAGCSRGTGNISGTVKFNGEPLPAGTITFYDQDNGTSSDAIKPDGTYSVKKVPTGPVKVAIAVPLPIPMVGPGGGEPLTLPVPKVPSIPANYLDAEQSGLGFEVKKGDQVHDFLLKP